MGTALGCRCVARARVLASKMPHDTPSAAVDAVSEYAGGRPIQAPIVKRALIATARLFVGDPRTIPRGFSTTRYFHAEVGTLKVKVDLAMLVVDKALCAKRVLLENTTI